VGLFGILWILVVWNGYGNRFAMLKDQVPVIVGAVVFILIGLYMMKSGVKRKAE
jgi:putative Mn2+ efflux pump MntP